MNPLKLRKDMDFLVKTQMEQNNLNAESMIQQLL